MRKPICFLAAVTAVVLLPALAGAAEDKAGAPTNVLVTIRISDPAAGPADAVQSYQLVALDGGPQVDLFAGTRVPIPVTTFQASTPPNREIVPMTSYTYQNVGFTAEVRAWLQEDGSVIVHADVEDSRLVPEPSRRGQPVIQSEQHRIKAVLDDGRPLKMTRNGTTADGFVEVEARILR